LRITQLNLFARHGGAERCAQDLLHGLRGRGHDAKLLIGRTDARERDLNAHVKALPAGRWEHFLHRVLHRLVGLTDTALLSSFRHVRSHPDIVDADIVHAHNLHGGYFNLWALPYLARRRPLVLTLHDMWLLTGDCEYSQGCERWRKKCGACPVMRRPRAQRGALGGVDLTRVNLAIKRAALSRIPPHRLVVVAPSRWLGDQAAQSHLGRFSVRVIPNGVNLNVFAPMDQSLARGKLRLPRESLLLAAIASNWDNPHKGGDLLHELARRMRAQQLGRLVVVGRMGALLRGQLTDWGAIVRDGWHGNEDLRDVFSACDGFLMLSRSENLPYVVSEALGCGCPPIARDVGGVGEMFHDGVHGRLVPVASGAAGFLSAIRDLHGRSATECRAVRRAAREHAQRVFGLSSMVRAYENVYEELLASPASRSIRRPRAA